MRPNKKPRSAANSLLIIHHDVHLATLQQWFASWNSFRWAVLGALFGAGVIFVSWHSLAKSCSAKVRLGAAVVALAASSSPPSASSISVDQNNLTSCH